MDVLVAHLREYCLVYAVGAACVLPIIYLPRRYSVPIIFDTVEIAIYMVIMHVVVWLLVNLARWFRENSSMKALDASGRPLDAPTWDTPLLTFWQRELYDPAWVFWVEVALAALIVLAVWRYRPMRVKRPRKRRAFKNEMPGRGQRSVRGGGARPAPPGRGR